MKSGQFSPGDSFQVTLGFSTYLVQDKGETRPEWVKRHPAQTTAEMRSTLRKWESTNGLENMKLPWGHFFSSAESMVASATVTKKQLLNIIWAIDYPGTQEIQVRYIILIPRSDAEDE